MKQLISILIIISFLSCKDKNNLKILNQSNKIIKKSSINKIDWIHQKITSTITKNNIPALSVAIIENGNVTILNGYGLMKRNSNQQINKNSLYQIGSLSKMYTGIIANNLISEGILKLKESIITYLPKSLPNKTKEKLKNIRLIDLLQHRAGIPRNSLVIDRIDGNPMLSGYSEKNLLKDLNLMNLESKPNTNFEYSNIGYAILGYICENASNKTYATLLQIYISQKYQLKNTHVKLKDSTKLVTPYRKDDRMVITKAWKTEKLTPASGIYSDINDISILMKYQLKAYQMYKNKKS